MWGSIEKRFWDKVVPILSGCWIWTGATNADDYGRFSISGRNHHAHRVSWEIHNGPIPTDMWVLHKCDTPSCMNPEHLFLGTHQDNMDDMVDKGRASSCLGESNPNTKLTEEQVLEIRELLANTDMLQREIAELYDVCQMAISEINTGRRWSSV